MVKRPHAAAVAAATLVALIGGCSSAAVTKLPSTIDASVKEFSVTLDSAEAAAGKVSFKVQNSGSIAHEFVVFRTDLATDKVTVKDGQADEEETGLSHVDEVEGIAPGSSKTLSVDLPPGRYLLICNLPGHFQGGMHVNLQVSS
jgi:uncharacterized cupredoxin-like copper-binding protein